MTAVGRERLAWTLGIIVFLTLYVPLENLIPPSHCADGWESPSIGTRGACSHHGGVVRYTGRRMLAFAFSLAIATMAGLRSMPRPAPMAPRAATTEEIVRGAIAARRRIKFRYQAKGQGEPTERVVLPESVTGWQSKTYVTGFCELRKASRTFSVRRMTEVRVLDS